MTTKKMTTIALVTAVICIIAPYSIPIGTMPVTFTNLAIYFALYITGTKITIISYIIYYLLGIIGLPVFSGFSGGVAKAIGPTGGCLIGFIFMILISGLFIEKYRNKKILQLLGMIIGTIVLYLIGGVWFSFVMDTSLKNAFVICVAPFIIGDLFKIIAAMIFGAELRKRLIKAGIKL